MVASVHLSPPQGVWKSLVKGRVMRRLYGFAGCAATQLVLLRVVSFPESMARFRGSSPQVIIAHW